MKIILKGHEYRYAVEQTVSTLFPGAKPEYCAPSEAAEGLAVSLSRGAVYTTAVCVYRTGSGCTTGRAAVKTALLTDRTETDRLCQFIIKNAIYRAVRSSGMARPPWGALTGVRPGKLMAGMLREAAGKEAACMLREAVEKEAGNTSENSSERNGSERADGGRTPGAGSAKIGFEKADADWTPGSGSGRAAESISAKAKNEAVSRFVREYDVTPERARLCCETSMETLAAESSLQEKDICLYVGIPFCPTRCAYCSFVSQSVEKNIKLIAPFFEALKREVRAVAGSVKAAGLRPVSIYFGGGTPTTLSARQLDELCGLLSEEFDLSGLREFTVEAGRPDTITAEKLSTLRSHGVDRLSVNPQTMRDSVLEAIGRKHTAADVERALELVRAAGGFTVNMDLIAGLPSDTPEGFSYTMDRVLQFSPENITVHTLSLKRGSALTLNGGAIPESAEVKIMLDSAYVDLRKNGYTPYYLYRQKNMSGGFENTGWTKPGHANLYNICMMEELCGILAMGGGGSTKLIRGGSGKNLRLTAPKYPLEYIELIEKTCADKKLIGDFYKDLQAVKDS